MNLRNTKHGQSKTRLYATWQNMKNRCYYEGFIEFDRYGGRGIEVCQEWRDNFVPFYEWAMASGYAEGLTLDRIDNDGNYCPENCRWLTKKAQQNNRSNNRYLTYNGKTQSVAQWAEELGVCAKTIRTRISRGWSIEKALLKKAK